MIDKWIKTVLAIVALFIFLSIGTSQARAENHWGFGTDIGFLADTANDTVFTMSFQGDYYVDSAFSIGPQLMISPGGDFTHISLS